MKKDNLLNNKNLLLVEVLTEELPPPLLADIANQFSANLLGALHNAGFADEHTRAVTNAAGDAPCLATPRRIAALLRGVHAQTPPREVVRKGPQTAAGMDANGKPTKALAGFARAHHALINNLIKIRDDSGREFFALRRILPGRKLDDDLSALLKDALTAISAPRMMRWGAGEFRFVRPVRGVAALHNRRVMRGDVFGVAIGAQTRGRRAAGSLPIKLQSAAHYQGALAKGGIIADFNARLGDIRKQLHAALAGGDKLADGAEALMREAAAMTESPFVFRGEIRESELMKTLPAFCVTTCMQKHQRYFPALSNRGALRPYFLFVADNAPAKPARMIRGFERVLAARLNDAAFFYREDKKTNAAENLEKLKAVVYHRKLGSQFARAKRIEEIAAKLAAQINIDAAANKTLAQAARICKADLPTRMIDEYPELEGLMAARYFAATPAVARVVAAHVSPSPAQLRANDALFCLCAAAALEKLCGLFYAGEIPSGSKDPHGLRRAALLLIDALSQNRHANALRLSLRGLITLAGESFRENDGANEEVFSANNKARVNEEIFHFLAERLRARYLSIYSPQIVAAALAQAPDSPPLFAAKLAALKKFRDTKSAPPLANANKRINNILRKSAAGESLPPVDERAFQCEEERALYRAVCRLEKRSAGLAQKEQFAEALAMLAGASAPIDAFFEKVLVNSADAKIRRNRLSLLSRLRALLNQVADISQLAI